MSVNMNGSGDTDYSDFEYQQITATPRAEGQGNLNTDFLFEYGPIDSIGGLDNNEVAELVYLELHASMEYEDEEVQQEVSTSAEMRGFLGANINSGNGLVSIEDRVNASVGTGSGSTSADDRVFQIFQARSIPPNDGTAGGEPSASGGSQDSGLIYEKPWRQLTGRGPILDSSDNLVLSGSITVGDALSGLVGGNVRAHLIWDVAETSDAGRAFSVPDSMM